MERTKLKDRQLPDYTLGEEVFNSASHILGALFGVAALVVCLAASVRKGDAWAVVSSAVYGASLILLYSMSGIYHGLPANTGKKVMQVIDHCTIYFLIGGTYTPVVLCAIRPVSPGWAWTIFGLVWGFAAMATVFTAIDLKKYAKLSMICYLGMGWCIVMAVKPALEAIEMKGILLLLAGGISYTVGAVLYGLGKNHRYMHSVFHIFVVAGSVLHFICILRYIL